MFRRCIFRPKRDTYSENKGVYHKMSVKHQRYIDESCGRYNVRQIDTMNQIDSIIHGLMGAKELTYKEFVS